MSDPATQEVEGGAEREDSAVEDEKTEASEQVAAEQQDEARGSASVQAWKEANDADNASTSHLEKFRGRDEVLEIVIPKCNGLLPFRYTLCDLILRLMREATLQHPAHCCRKRR